MKKVLVALMIVILITISISITVFAEYTSPIPTMPQNMPYYMMFSAVNPDNSIDYVILATDKPLTCEMVTHYLWPLEIYYEPNTSYVRYLNIHGENVWQAPTSGTWINAGTMNATEAIMANYGLGLANTDLEVDAVQNNFLGIDFDYEGFFGDLKVKVNAKNQNGIYGTLKEWTYPTGAGTVSIPASEVPQGTSGEYQIVIYEGDTIIQTYNYTMDVQKERTAEIIAPGDNASVPYFPNIQYNLKNTPKSKLVINGETVKWIEAAGDALMTGIATGSAETGFIKLGVNVVQLIAEDGTILDENQFTVTREGEQPTTVTGEGFYPVTGDFFEKASWLIDSFVRLEGIIFNGFKSLMSGLGRLPELVSTFFSFAPKEYQGLLVISLTIALFTGLVWPKRGR